MNEIKINYNKNKFYSKLLCFLIIFFIIIPLKHNAFGSGLKTINVVSSITNDEYPTELYFSNTKPLTVSLSIQQATEANETIEIDINNYLILDGISFTNASTFLTSDPTITNLGTGTGKDLAKKITLKLKEGVSGSFTMGITAHFSAFNSSHNDTANITVTQKQNGVTVGSPQNFAFSLFNDSKPDVFITKSGSISPGGTVTYSVYFRRGRQQRGETTYAYSSVNPGINYSASAIIPLPNIGVENVQVITPDTTNYDSINNIINVNGNMTDTYVGQFKVKYSDTLTVGTTIKGDEPSFSGNTPLLKPLTESDLKAPIAPISDTVIDPPLKSMSFWLLGPFSNEFLIGENANTYYTLPEAVNKAGLFGFSFNNKSPYDYNNVEVDIPVPDGLKVTGFKIPSNNNVSAQWKSTSVLTVEYTKNDDTVVTKTITPSSSMQYFTKTTLGLADNEYIKSFKFKFDQIASGDFTHAHNNAYTVNFYFLGSVDTHYRDGKPILNNDKLNIPGRELKLNASYDADDTAGINMVSVANINKSMTYTTTQRAGIAAQSQLVNPVTKVPITNTSFYPNDKGMLRLYLSATSIEYGNTQKLTNPILWFKIADSFIVDTTSVTKNVSTPDTLSIDSVSEVTGTAIPNGYKLYKIKTNGYLVSNAPNNSNVIIYTNSSFYIPFTVNKYAPPASYDTSFANALYYVGSDEQILSGYSLPSVVDTYKFQGPTPTRNLMRIDHPSYNFIQFLNIIGSGFQMFHQIKSDYGGVFKTSYDEADNSTIAKFTNTQVTGTLQALFANNDSQSVDGSTFVYYETLPKGVNDTDAKIVLTGPPSYTDVSDVEITQPWFKILYSTALAPERNVLTGGSDTTYIEQSSITDWSLVTGFKIVTTQDVPGSTTVKFNFPIEIKNATAYDTLAIANASEYRIAIVGGAPLTTYQSSNLAATSINTHATLSGKVFYDHNSDGLNDVTDEGINNINVELYKVGTPDTLIANYSTKNGGPLSPTDGYYEFINIDPSKYYLKFVANDIYNITTTSVNINTPNSLTISSDTTNKKSIATSQSFDLVATNDFTNVDVGMIIHPKIVINPTVETNGVTLEKVYDDKIDEDYDTYFKSFITVFDKAVQISDLSGVSIDYGSFKDNIKKNGILGEYPIKLIYTNQDNNTAEVIITAKIVDTKAPTITTTQETYSFSVNASAPSGSWEEYITSNFNIDNAQDDFISSNLIVDFGTFDPSVVGTYTATASYTDANGNVSNKNKVTINVQRTIPVITPNDSELTTNGITLEKVTDIKSDYESFFRGLVTLIDEGYPHLTSDDLDIIGVDELSAAMEKNGTLGNYVIAYDAENSDGGRSSYSIVVKVVDTTPAIINIVNTELAIDQNSSIPDGFTTWEQYIYNVASITVTDDQDDVITDLHLDMPFDMQIGLGNFNPQVPGIYNITVDYTDLSTTPIPFGNKSVTQNITFTVNALPVVKGNNFIVERGTFLGNNDQDKIKLIKTKASISAIDPMNSQTPMTEDITGVSEIDTLTVGIYSTHFKYTNLTGETTLQIDVSVVDTIKPIITLTPNVSLKIGGKVNTPLSYIVSATDTDAEGVVKNLKENVTFKIYNSKGLEVDNISTKQLEKYSVVYNLDDGFGNMSEQKTLKIEIVPNIYKVTWILNNDETNMGYDVKFGGTIEELLNLVKIDHVFNGWFLDENLTKPAQFPIINLLENKTFYASWIKRLDDKTNTTQENNNNVYGGTTAPSRKIISENYNYDKPKDIFENDNLLPINKINFNGPYLYGYEDNTIKPDNNVTRAETIQIIYNIYGRPDINNLNDITIYKDINNLQWYSKAAIFLTKYNLLKGYPDQTFGANKPITRAELITLLVRYSNITDEYNNDEIIFKDITDHWAKPYINAAYKNNIILGYSGQTFRPDDFATRAELVVIINKILNRSDKWICNNKFSDLYSTHWAYKNILNASNGYVEK